jgi:uncharacterized spore protein YtfJ
MENVESLLKSSLAEIERVLTTKTVVGEPIRLDGTTIIPLVSIGFGFGAGGGSGKSGKAENDEGGGAATGGGGGIKPIAIIVINQDGVRVEPIRAGGIAAGLLEQLGAVASKALDKDATPKPR